MMYLLAALGFLVALLLLAGSALAMERWVNQRRTWQRSRKVMLDELEKMLSHDQ